jgi:hypothetical protein
MRSKTRTIRITAAAGTNLACAFSLVTFIIFTKKRALQYKKYLQSLTRTRWVVLEYIAQNSLLLSFMLRYFFKPVVADHSLKPARHLRLGLPLPRPTTIIPNRPINYAIMLHLILKLNFIGIALAVL